MITDKFNGVTDWRSDLYNQNLIHGVIDWCRWAMLKIGGFQNVLVSHGTGIYGGELSRLRLVDDPNYTNGQVWESARADWVWETGIGYSVEPKFASGVYVNSTFYPTASTTGTYAHHINFPLGRVVFNSAISTNSVVKADYSYRSVAFGKSKEVWFQELLYDSFKVERDDFLTSSGSHSQLAQARRQLPAVGMELVTRRQYVPYEIGGGQYINQDMLMYILAENETDRDQLVDILANQDGRTIWIPNRAWMKASANYPLDLDYRGSPVASPMQFPEIIAATGDGGFAWNKVLLGNTTVQLMQTVNSWLYRAVVRTTFSAVFENI